MNKKVLLDSEKNFYKGNMHCHSNLSDGFFSPQELKDLYKSKGYSFLSITDHEHFNSHHELDDDEFIMLTGAEYGIKEFPEQSTLVNHNMKSCHFNFYAKEQENTNSICYSADYDHYTKGEKREELKRNAEPYERIYSGDGVNDLIRIANENGFFVCYNHPRWSLENYKQYSEYEGLWGVEIYNTGVNVGGIYDYDINVLDDFHRDGKRVFASCGDDNHNANKENHLKDSFGAFVMVNAKALSYANIVKGLLEGSFYSSTGPEIFELYVEDGKVHIKCSECETITYSTYGRRSKAVTDACLNSAEFEIKDTDIYFRIDVVDKFGKRANTQCYYIDELQCV